MSGECGFQREPIAAMRHRLALLKTFNKTFDHQPETT